MLNSTQIGSKRKKVEDAVLKKARKFVDKPQDYEAVAGEVLRLAKKPRHTLEEKMRAKSQKTEDKPQVPTKKKSKNKKKKKKKQAPKEKNLDQETKRQNEALCYLKLWEKHRDQWKFEKLKQIWLLKNALKPTAINDTNFEILLNYGSSIKGRSRNMLLTDMKQFVESYESKFATKDESTDLQSSEIADSDASATEFDKLKYERARKFLQMLSDESDDE